MQPGNFSTSQGLHLKVPFAERTLQTYQHTALALEEHYLVQTRFVGALRPSATCSWWACSTWLSSGRLAPKASGQCVASKMLKSQEVWILSCTFGRSMSELYPGIPTRISHSCLLQWSQLSFLHAALPTSAKTANKTYSSTRTLETSNNKTTWLATLPTFWRCRTASSAVGAVSCEAPACPIKHDFPTQPGQSKAKLPWRNCNCRCFNIFNIWIWQRWARAVLWVAAVCTNLWAIYVTCRVACQPKYRPIPLTFCRPQETLSNRIARKMPSAKCRTQWNRSHTSSIQAKHCSSLQEILGNSPTLLPACEHYPPFSLAQKT